MLRGPFSSLYGNAAGGVIVVETEDPPEKPTVGIDVMGGSYDTWRAGVRLGGYNTLFDASRFESDGYREHSACGATSTTSSSSIRCGPKRRSRSLATSCAKPRR